MPLHAAHCYQVCLTFRLTALALAFLIIPFLPASNLLFRVGFVIAERILYSPSAGFIILLVLGAAKLSARSEIWKQVSPMYRSWGPVDY